MRRCDDDRGTLAVFNHRLRAWVRQEYIGDEDEAVYVITTGSLSCSA